MEKKCTLQRMYLVREYQLSDVLQVFGEKNNRSQDPEVL